MTTELEALIRLVELTEFLGQAIAWGIWFLCGLLSWMICKGGKDAKHLW